MQPYVLPYLGYFQLIHAVDRFVMYDTVKYTKKGWINRNRFLRNGEATTFSIPLAKGSDELNVADRRVAECFDPAKLRARIECAYRKAPHFAETMAMVDRILDLAEGPLYDFLSNAVQICCAHLKIDTPILTASRIEGGATGLRGAERVIDICDRLGAATYVNPPGGRHLYDPAAFRERGVRLRFLEPDLRPYPQFGTPFVAGLSILDVLMFVSPEEIAATLLGCFQLDG